MGSLAAGPTIVFNTFSPLIFRLYSFGLLIGGLYSVPPFSFKRFPVLAGLTIACVRGFLLNFGVYYAVREALGLSFQWNPAVLFLARFMTVFAGIIAVTKVSEPLFFFVLDVFFWWFLVGLFFRFLLNHIVSRIREMTIDSRSYTVGPDLPNYGDLLFIGYLDPNWPIYNDLHVDHVDPTLPIYNGLDHLDPILPLGDGVLGL